MVPVMNESNRSPATCERCGALLAPGALQELCPRCLMELHCGAATEAQDDEAPSLEPDLHATIALKDFLADRDPALETALHHLP